MAISTAKLAADAVTAAAKVDVSELFADSAVIGAIQSSSITTSAVVSAIGSFEFIQADNIVAGAITGAKLSVNTIEANKIKLDGLTLDSDGDNLVIKTGGGYQPDRIQCGHAGSARPEHGHTDVLRQQQL